MGGSCGGVSSSVFLHRLCGVSGVLVRLLCLVIVLHCSCGLVVGGSGEAFSWGTLLRSRSVVVRCEGFAVTVFFGLLGFSSASSWFLVLRDFLYNGVLDFLYNGVLARVVVWVLTVLECFLSLCYQFEVFIFEWGIGRCCFALAFCPRFPLLCWLYEFFFWWNLCTIYFLKIDEVGIRGWIVRPFPNCLLSFELCALVPLMYVHVSLYLAMVVDDSLPGRELN